jgi:hypothetical protein
MLAVEGYSLLLDSIRAMNAASPREFYTVLLVSAAFAMLAWWTAAKAPTLWNPAFQLHGPVKALCALAALVTVTFGIAIASLSYAKEVATTRVMEWRAAITRNRKAENDAAAKVYRAVRDSGLETFGAEHTLGPNGANYPVTKPETRKLTSRTYVAIALEDFQATHPALYRAIWRGPKAPYDRALEDRQNSSATPSYPVSRYFEVASQEVLQQLQWHADGAVYSARRGLAALILCAQAIALSAAAFASLQRPRGSELR